MLYVVVVLIIAVLLFAMLVGKESPRIREEAREEEIRQSIR